MHIFEDVLLIILKISYYGTVLIIFDLKSGSYCFQTYKKATSIDYTEIIYIFIFCFPNKLYKSLSHQMNAKTKR